MKAEATSTSLWRRSGAAARQGEEDKKEEDKKRGRRGKKERKERRRRRADGEERRRRRRGQEKENEEGADKADGRREEREEGRAGDKEKKSTLHKGKKDKKEEKKDTQIRKVLPITEEAWLLPPCTPAMIAASQAKLKAGRADEARKQREAALNDLEGYIYSVKGKIQEQEEELGRSARPRSATVPQARS